MNEYKCGVSYRKAQRISKMKKRQSLEIIYSPLGSCRWSQWRYFSLAAVGLARRRSIHGWPWSGRLRLACSRAPVGKGTSRGWRRTLKDYRRKTLEDYVTNKRKATLIGNDVRTSLRRISPSLGRLRLSRPRYRTILHRSKKVHHLYLPLLRGEYVISNLTSSLFFFLFMGPSSSQLHMYTHASPFFF